MSIEIQKKVSLKTYTTLGVGGEAESFVLVTNDEELIEAVEWARAEGVSFSVLGSGSNTLVSDAGVIGLVIHIASKGMTSKIVGSDVFLTVQAGELLDDVVLHCVEQGWWGIENLSHIPGTVGATPVQNVGAYGVEVKDVITTVSVCNTETKKNEDLQNADCDFGYRDSIFKKNIGKKYIVTSVTFKLSSVGEPKIHYKDLATKFEGTIPTLQQIRDAVIAIRSVKFPNWKEVGTAGSFFKNPTISTELYKTLQAKYPALPAFPVDTARVKISLGWVLDKVLNLRGYTSGPVATYQNQALVLVADHSATAKEIEQFADEIILKIKNEIGIDVEWEVSKLK